MSRFEDELKQALQRREAPPDFAERVLQRIAALPQPQSRWQRLTERLRLPQVRLAAALACLLIAALVGVPQYRQYQQQKYEQMMQEGEIAKAQVMFAFQIASSKLNKAKQKVSEVTERGAAAKPDGELQSETKQPPEQKTGEARNQP